MRAVIVQLCEINPTVTGRDAGPLAGEFTEPMERCCKCPSRTDKKTRFRCHCCFLAVCPHHYYAICDSCVWCWGKFGCFRNIPKTIIFLWKVDTYHRYLFTSLKEGHISPFFPTACARTVSWKPPRSRGHMSEGGGGAVWLYRISQSSFLEGISVYTFLFLFIPYV